MKILTILLALVINSAFACPEVNGVDLADGDGPWTYIEIERNDIVLTEAEFNKMPLLNGMYAECKDALVAETIQSKITGRKFIAVMTTKDECDGGNSMGALYNDSMTKILGDIGDSYITCY